MMKSSDLSNVINAGILATSRTLVPSALSRPPIEDEPVEIREYTFNWNWRSLLQQINILPIFQASQHFYSELTAWHKDRQ
jgi:hypothetical protein